MVYHRGRDYKRTWKGVREGGGDDPGKVHLLVGNDPRARTGRGVEAVGADKEAGAEDTPGGEVNDGPVGCVWDAIEEVDDKAASVEEVVREDPNGEEMCGTLVLARSCTCKRVKSA